jgi:streptogramin lyase
MMKRQFSSPMLLALTFTVAACGDGNASNGGSSTGGANAGAANTGGTTAPNGVGGVPSGCKWVGAGWACDGNLSAPTSGGNSTTGGANGGQANSSGNGGAPSASGAPGGGGTPGSNGPSISITELPIPMSSEPGLIVTGKDGNLWFNNETTGPSSITRMTPAGVFTRFNTAVTNIGPVGIAAGSDGNVWYAKQQGIGLVTPDGKITERGVPGGRDSGYLTNGPGGNLWFTEPVANKLASVTPAGMFTEYTVPTPNAGPFAIATGPDGNLWFTEQHSAGNKIGRMTPAGAFTEFPIPTPASNAFGITAGADGNLWFTEQDGHKIGRITPAGVLTEFAIPSGGSPGAITSGPDGNVWFVEFRDNAIGRVTPDGVIAEYSIPTPRSVPTGICAGPDKNIYFTQLDGNQVGRITNLTGGGNIAPGLKPDDAPGAKPMPCTDDTDCNGAGKACGGDVCSAPTHTCVAATSQDLGTCSTAAKCWCAGQGATCDASTHHCSFTTFGN